jgi:beta-lactamase regulating signal transducer with metallopeptidase domain
LPLKSAGAIAGVAVACTLAVVFIITLVVFLCFRRRKRRKQDKIRKAESDNRQEEEKAQLHSEDLKPIRKELSGDQPLASKKDVPIAEMPANEDPQRTAGEMPANEAVGSELPGESNEEKSEEKGSSNTVCQSN